MKMSRGFNALTLITTLFLSTLPSFAEDSSRDKEIALDLSFQEAKIIFVQREHSWKPDFEGEDYKKPSQEQKSPFKIEGYYKNLFISSKTSDTKANYFNDLNRLRLDCQWDISQDWLARGIFDQEALIHDFKNSIDFLAVKNKNKHKTAALDTDAVYTDSKHLYAQFSLYRGYVKYDRGRIQAVLGEQLIDWGRSRFFSPMDLFNPLSPTSVEKDERIGVDAFNAEYTLNPQSKINLVYGPMRTFKKSSLGSRLYYQAGDYDLFFSAGQFKGDTVAGFCFDGYLGNGGIRGEFTQTHADNGRNYFRGVIGGEYSFPNKWQVLAEYFYNGGADNTQPERFTTDYEFSSEVLTQKRNFLSLWTSYEITPLLKWENYLIYNIDGPSGSFNPELRYNIWTNFDFSLGAQVYWGRSDSEFGDYQNLYYGQAKYFF